MSLSSLLLEEKKAMLYVEETRKKAEGLVKKARREAEEILKQISDEEKLKNILDEYRKELEREAEELLSEYRRRAEAIRSIPEELREKAVEHVVKEVLEHEF